MSGFGPDRWRAVSPYLDQALALTDEERTGWLAALGVQHPEIAADIRRLLDDHRALVSDRFLERGPLTSWESPALAGQTVGAYRLVSPIGQGGMGSVWLAERSDGRFERRAAVKFLSVALAGRGEERFRREGSILGRLTHGHIAQLLDAGVMATGQPYLVLEHVDGEPIDQYCEHHGLDVEARIRLFLDVVMAVAHAHANLIVHRDIKPSNVLVGADGHVKLLDFGIAKLLEDEGQEGAPTLLTREGGLALTPAYAAPEQMTGGTVSTATDVYALGVLLFVLLTGQHPAGAQLRSHADLIKAIVDAPPRRPSEAAGPALRRVLRGDLDTIVLKALKKDPQERYASVTALGDDLARYLRHEPISARRDALAYRAAKFMRRNRTVVALAGLALVISVAGVVATLLQAGTARAQRDFALRELSRAEAVNDLNTFVLSDAAPSGKPFTVDDLLARAEHIVARQHGSDAGRVELLISIGRQYQVQDEYAKARTLLEEAHTLSRGLADRSTRARASCALAQSLANGPDLARAETLLQEGLAELPADPQFVLDRIFCLQRGSEIAVRRGASQEAIARARAAEALLGQAPLRSDLLDLDTLINLAGAYSNAGQPGQASATFERASQRLAALGRDDTSRGATLFNNWGLALYMLGRPLDAERAFHRAIDVSRDNRSEDAVSSNLLVNYSRVLQELGRLDEAADYAERGYEKARQAGAEVVMSQVSLLLGSIYRGRGDLVRAERMLAGAEPWLRSHLPAGHIAFGAFASQRSLLAQARGDLRAALDTANQAVAIAEASIKAGRQGADYLPIFLVRRSDLELQLGQASEAAADADRALKTAQLSVSPGTLTALIGRAYLSFGKALQALGRQDEARAALRSAAEHLQSALGPDHADTRAARQLAGLP